MSANTVNLSISWLRILDRQRTVRLRWLRQMEKGFWSLSALPFVAFLTVPLLALFLRTHITTLFTTLNQAQVFQAVTLSLVTSLTTTLIALLFGTPVAYVLAQRNSHSFHILDTLIDLPTVLPPSVAGIALLLTFGRRGLFGTTLTAMGINIPFTMTAVIMAQIFVAASFYVKSAATGFAAVDSELKHAAELDGATRWQIFRHITLPCSWAALFSGSVMTWARALGEFGATIIFAGNFPGRTQTMPLAIYLGFEMDLKVALTLAVLLVCLSFIILISVKVVLHRQLGAE